jgi:hypothetical protein
MSKRLPYYQSEPAEYLAGDIMFCSYAAQGVFTIIRALYWQKDCKLLLSQVNKRLKDAGAEIKELVNEDIIKLEGEYIVIEFLDEQLQKLDKTSKTNSSNGQKGAQKRWGKPTPEKDSIAPLLNKDSETIATPLKSDSESIALREDKIRRDKIIEDNKNVFNIFWDLYDKKIGDKEKIFKKWLKLSTEDKEAIIIYIPKYKISQPEKKFRKNPETFLNNKSWNDEIIYEGKGTLTGNPVITDPRLM